MATISKTKWLTLLGAFHFLGRRKHHAKWVGLETKSIPKRTPKPRSDMEHAVPDLSDDEIVRRLRADKGERGGLKWADTWAELYGPALRESMGRDPEGWFLEKPEMEPERKVHREAEAEWLPPPKETWEKIKKGFWQSHWPPDPDSKEYLEAREAWERREDTIAALRTIMLEHGISSFLRIAGREVPLESSQWDPDNEVFEIDLLTGVCGEGKQKGPTFIEREPFIAVVDQLYPPPQSGLSREKMSEGGLAPRPTTRSIRKMIRIIQKEIKGPLTENAAISYFRENQPHTVHQDFRNGRLSEHEDKILWDDKDDQPKKMSFKTLARHRAAIAQIAQ